MIGGADGARRPGWRAYGFAVVLTLAVVAGRRALDPWWGHQHNRHLVFLPTVMLAAWLGGSRPGFVSAVLSTLALQAFWSDSHRGLWGLPTSDLVLFFLLSIALCALIGSLQAARLRADAAMRSKERVLEIVAHDLRNPLSAIKMTSAGLERAAPELRPRLKRIDHAVGRMDNLIRDLVDTTRIEHGEFVLSMALEPVASIIDETIEQFAPLAQDQGVALGVEAPPADVSVACDRGRIVQVLSNLVANALKFTDKGGRVTLTWAAEREEVRFDVADTGAGIRPEHLGHVFEQYWRADRAGTGLGLFIAKSVVGAHGGRIWVESEPGRGSNFHFVLPRPANARAVGDSN